MKRLWIYLIVTACYGFPVLSDAQQVTQMEEMVVTSSRIQEKKREVSHNMVLIGPEQIKLSTARDLGDLMAELNMGHIQRYPGALTSVGLRGARTDSLGNDLRGHLLVLIDSRRAGTGNLAKIPTENIERIEILNGPASVQYGSAAMGGIINVITKRGKSEPEAFVQGTTGSFDYHDWSAGVAFAAKGFDFSGSISESHEGDYVTADDQKYVNTGYDREEGMSFHLGYSFLTNQRIGLVYRSFKANGVGSPNNITIMDTDNQKNTKNDSYDIKYTGGLSSGRVQWMIRQYTTHDGDQYFDNPIGTYDSDKKTDQQGYQFQTTLDMDQYRLTIGWDYVNYEENYINNFGGKPSWSKYTNPAYFLLGKVLFFNERLILTSGLRYDDYDVELKPDEGGSESANDVNYQAGAAFMLKDDFKIRVNYGTAFVMPGARELAGDYTHSYTANNGNTTIYRYIGNAKLKPEKSRTLDGGLDYQKGAVNTALTYFHTEYEDMIEEYMVNTTAAGNTTTVNYSWDNVGESTVAGFEGKLSVDIGALLEWSYTVKPYVSFVHLTQYRNKTDDEDLKYIAPYQYTLGLTVSDEEGFSANCNVAHTDGKKVDDWVYGYGDTIEKESFTVVDLSISKRLYQNNRSGSVTLKVDIDNLLDENFAYVHGYTMPGRSFAVKLRYNY